MDILQPALYAPLTPPAGFYPYPPMLSAQAAASRLNGPLLPVGTNYFGDPAMNAVMTNQVLTQLVGLLSGMLLGSGGLSAPYAGQTQANSGGTTAAQSVADTSAGADAGGSGTLSSGPLNLGPGTKVLQIGDSHTVGAFGTEMDKLLRSSGAQVETYGSSGSSASSWIKGTPTHSGFVARHANGQVEQPPWNQTHATPRLADLINQNKPDVVIVNLGANFRGGGEAAIRQQVSQIGEVCKRAGIRLIWVGPPRTRDDASNPAKLQQFDAAMQAAMAPYGEYISSAPFTPRYAGGDGVHYSGSEGTALAQNWAKGVFGKLSGR